MRVSLKKIIYLIGWPLVYLLKQISSYLYQLSLTYEFRKDWACLPNPEWFNHEFDLAFFTKWRKPHFFERGVYLQEMLKPDHTVLDLCCGDGSVTALFIAPKVKHVIGVDFDPKAVQYASKKYSYFKNVDFKTMDIRSLDFPPHSFDIISWDAAIEHFSQNEMDRIFSSLKRILCPDGLLIGSTVAKQEHIQHHDHEYEFNSVDELKSFLEIYFPNVYAWQRRHEDRTSFYFRCSTSSLNLNTREENL